MKFAFKTILCAVFALSMFACGSSDKGDKIEAKEATETAAEATTAARNFAVDTNTSIINWTGSKSFVEDEHSGTIKVGKGMLSVENGQLAAGSFTIDMRSMKNTDIKDQESAGQLVGHLSSPDFFDTAKYPNAVFEITEVKPVTGDVNTTHNITGNLTMLDSTKQVTLPANVAIADNKLTATTPMFTIDRSQWGIVYGGEEAAKIANLAKDRIISDDISLKIMLNAAVQ
ncbi:MAG: YceI family protein [Bacteroidota bacterium]